MIILNNKLQNATERLADKLDIPREVIMDIPKITVVSNNEITIENHKGIILFEKEMVKVKSSIAIITILGGDFEIIFVGGSTIVLTGKFKSIEYGENE